MSKFGYATEEVLWADCAKKAQGPIGTIEDFRDYLRSIGCKEVILDGVRQWQFPPLAEARREWERKHGPWEWNNSVTEWQ